MKYFEKVSVPEGAAGSWCVERFTVTEKDVEIANMRAMFKPGGWRRMIPAGTYTRLRCGGQLVMTDTPAEMYEHSEPVFHAEGDVLLNGLGLGVVLKALLNKESVSSVTVVEKSEDVLSLVAPSYELPNVTFVHADAREWRPKTGVRYSVAWHDIWNDICSDNLPEMIALHRAYGRRCNWQGSWSREYLK